MTSEKVLENLIKRGATKVEAPALEMRDPALVGLTVFNEGDVFTIPANVEYYQTPVRGSDAVAYFILVEGKDRNSKEFTKQFFLSSCNKRVEVYETPISGKPLKSTGEYLSNDGTFIEKMREYETIAEGIQALAGKSVKVSKTVSVFTARYQSVTEAQRTRILTFDLV